MLESICSLWVTHESEIRKGKYWLEAAVNCYALFIDHFLHHLQQLRSLLLQSSCTRAAAFARIHRGVFVIRIPCSGFGGCNLSLSLRPRAFHVVIISKLSLHHCLTAVVAGLSQIPKEIATNSVECSPTLKRTQNGLLSHVIRWGVSSGLRAGARISQLSSQTRKIRPSHCHLMF